MGRPMGRASPSRGLASMWHPRAPSRRAYPEGGVRVTERMRVQDDALSLSPHSPPRCSGRTVLHHTDRRNSPLSRPQARTEVPSYLKLRFGQLTTDTMTPEELYGVTRPWRVIQQDNVVCGESCRAATRRLGRSARVEPDRPTGPRPQRRRFFDTLCPLMPCGII